MKRLKYLYLALFVGIFSCEDAIDIQQVGRLTPETVFVSVDDLQRGLIGVYSTFDITQEIALNASYTDEVAPGVGTGGQNFNTGFIFELNATSTASSTFWLRGYNSLNEINRLIVGAQNVSFEPSEEDEFNDILGQAYALRAYAHFVLLSYYTTDYEDLSALSIPIQTSIPSIADQPLRDTNEEVYGQIEDDLDLADTLLANQANPTFVSRDFVKALRVRVAAYKGDYATALPLAQELLAAYPLATTTTFPQIWTDESNAEVIFKFERTLNDIFDGQGASGSVAAGGWAGNVFAFTNATAGGGAYYEFSRNLFNLFDPADIRYTAYLAPDATVSPNYQTAADYTNEDILPVFKYPGSEGQNLMNDLKVFRSAEMLLIIAEAYADSGSLNGATNSVAATLKQLRDARFGSPQTLATFSNAESAYNAILNERRIELAFEGHRWKDVKRLGAKANQNITRDPLDCENFVNGCELLNNDFRLTLPLPVIEFQGNPGLRSQQNPGYN